jgi:hypothetical protein
LDGLSYKIQRKSWRRIDHEADRGVGANLRQPFQSVEIVRLGGFALAEDQDCLTLGARRCPASQVFRAPASSCHQAIKRSEPAVEVGLLEIDGRSDSLTGELRESTEPGCAVVGLLRQPDLVAVEVAEQACVMGCEDKLRVSRIGCRILEQGDYCF